MRAADNPTPPAAMQSRPARWSATGIFSGAAQIPLLIGTLLLGAILRLIDLAHQGLWVDELYVIWEGRQPLSTIFDPNLHLQHPPGYRLLMHIWMGPRLTEAWIKLVPALAGIALIAIAWGLAKELWPARPSVATIVALLVATSPYMVHYSRDVTTYSWTATWISLSFLLVLLAWRRNSAWLWAAWSVSLLVSMYSHYFAVFPLFFEVAGVGIMLVRSMRRQELDRRKLISATLAVMGAAALYAPWIYIFLAHGQNIPTVFFPLSVDNQPVHWLAYFVAGYPNAVFWIYQRGFTLILLVFAALLLWATWRITRTRRTKRPVAIALVLGWFVAAVIGPYFVMRISYPPGSSDPVRFATFAAPALLLGLAALIVSMPKAVRALVLAAWLVMSGVQWWTELTTPPPQDWRSVLSIVAAQGKPTDAMLAFPAFHAGAAAAYYTLPMPVKGGWFISDGSDPTGAAYWFPSDWRWQGFLNTHADRSTDFKGELEKRTQGATRLWYLAGEGTLDGNYVPSPAMERAIASEGWQQENEWHYAPLDLKLYTRPAAPAP